MTKSTVPRRRIVAAAWAAPVVALAVTAPSAAASTCEPVTYRYDPRDYTDHRGPQHNAAIIEVTMGKSVIVTFIRDYPNASALNVDHKLYGKRDRGFRVGDVVAAKLDPCVDPRFVQIDGNNVHYYGGGRFA